MNIVSHVFLLKKCILASNILGLKIIYNFLMILFELVLKTVALFNQKIKKGITGRAKTFSLLENYLTENDKTIWFHCASLGEYEQGFPVFKAVRADYPTHKIILSFFSPSGYEIRKNTDVANYVVYLPLDTSKNAKRFIKLINPELSIFVKYDIWPNYLNELSKKKLRAILISAVFRTNQPYFKFYGSFLKDSLFNFEHIFTQNKKSKELLKSIGYNSVSVSGDTRFDRVIMQLKQNNNLGFIDTFKGNNLCFVAGSTWAEDEAIIKSYINNHSLNNIKFIIAPHNIKSDQIKNLVDSFNKPTVLFSEKNNKALKSSKVLIVDTIGLLSRIYSYANIAYVGGALGTTGLHNTLEPAVFGIPIIIGPNHQKFPEAQAMIDNGGMFVVKNQAQFDNILDYLVNDGLLRKEKGSLNVNYINKNTGAVIHILNYLRIYNNFE